MVENSKIEWTDHTFNPVVGCQKVGPGCDNCYAEALAKRTGMVEWGEHAERRVTSDVNWSQPVKWNRRAREQLGRPARVFCASMSDWADNRWPLGVRERLFELIRNTPDLIWLLLTKRIGNVPGMLPPDWGDGYPNVCLLVTVVNQEEADRDVPKLLATPARWRGLSMEPLLGAVDIKPWIGSCFECSNTCGWRAGDLDYPPEDRCNFCGHVTGDAEEFCPECGGQDWSGVCPRCDSNVVFEHDDTVTLDWIIVGGESGHRVRHMDPAWARSLRDQCRVAGVPFFMKQMTKKAPIPADLLVREFPTYDSLSEAA